MTTSMERKHIGAAVAAVFVLLVALVVGFVYGVGPAPGDSGDQIQSFPVGDDSDTNAFELDVKRITECGRLCRDVTTTLTNNQSSPATGTTVYTRIVVGNGTDGSVVWTGRESVGRLVANESYTATRRITLSVANANTVRSNDGWITVQTTVQTDGRTVTFTEQRNVL